jgi:hypothetical protein
MASAILALVKSLDTGRTGGILKEVQKYIRIHKQGIYGYNISRYLSNYKPIKRQNSPARTLKPITLIQEAVQE